MNSRTVLIASVVLAGLTGGSVLLQALAHLLPAAPWPVLLLAYFGGAFGMPIGLGALATHGRYKAMVRTWSSFGLLAIALLAAGASAAARTLAGGGQADARLALALGAGLFTGLGIVKLALRRGRASAGG